MRTGAAAVALLLALLVAACGDDDDARPSPAASASPTPTSTPAPSPTSTGTVAPPREVGGITFYTWDAWLAREGSLCASASLEGPFFGPAVYSVRDDELPEIPLPHLELLDVRMCKLEGVTAVNYIMTDAWVLLVVGPPEWVTYGELDGITAQTIGGVEVVTATALSSGIGPMAARLTPWGMVVARGPVLTQEEAIDAVLAVNLLEPVPLGEETFTGVLNGINFYPGAGYGSDGQCRYGTYGFSGAQATGFPGEVPPEIDPGYLPQGASLSHSTLQVCGEVKAAEASYSVAGSDQGYTIIRKTEEPEWFSVLSRDWYTETQIAGLNAVLVQEPPGLQTDIVVAIHVREEFGLTTVYGPDAEEVIRIAENLNR